MAGKNKAVRKKSAVKKPVIDLRATRFTATSQTCNSGKFNAVRVQLDRVRCLKRSMSTFVHARLPDLRQDKHLFIKQYKQFDNKFLNAWETQTVFQGVCTDYLKRLSQVFEQRPLRRVIGYTVLRYQKKVFQSVKNKKSERVLQYLKNAPKPNSYTVTTTSTQLTNVCNYLMQVSDLNAFQIKTVADKDLAKVMQRFVEKPMLWQRIIGFVVARKVRLFTKVKCNHYTTGTYALSPKQSNAEVVIDKTNKEYQVFLKLRKTNQSADGFHYLPLLYDKRYKKPEDMRPGTQFLLKAHGKKISVVMSYEAPVPVFSKKTITKSDAVVLGLDANSKTNLLSDTSGKFYDIDRIRLDTLIALLSKLLPERDAPLSWQQKARLKKLMLRNQEDIKALLSQWVSQWAQEGVTDIVLEDLSLNRDATLIRHPLHSVKYSKLTRLLRLSNVKAWLSSMAEKKHIRVHTTHAAYTSQECAQCHHIDRDNRLTQESFVCKACKHTVHADKNAATNIRSRVTVDVLRQQLHTFDKYGRATPKPMRYNEVKTVLRQHYAAPGGLNESLTPG